MPSMSGFRSPDAELDAATERCRLRIKELNREKPRNVAEREAVAQKMAAAKDEWFLEFGKAVIRSRA